MAGPKTDESGRIKRPEPQNGGDKPVEPVVLARRAIEGMKLEITRALPKHVTPDRMLRVLLTALSSTPKLAECTRESFLGAILQASQLGLEPNTPLGHAWLLPYNNRKENRVDCQLIIGYQGMIDLSLRSGRVGSIWAQTVREGDYFEYELGLHPKLRHIPSEDADREERPITHAYAVARIKDAEPVFEVMSLAKIRLHAMRSATWDHQAGAPKHGPWLTDFEAMCRKTAVRAVWKYVPKSTEMARAEAVELANEKGDTMNGLDEAVKDALERQGVTPIYAQPPQSQPTEPQSNVDIATGEVRQPEATPAQ